MATVHLKGEPLQTIGSLPKVGTQAPDFSLTRTDLGEIKLKNYLGKKIVLNIFPSLDTATCASAMKHFNEIAINNPELLILCVSADLPFAQKRFCSAECLNNVMPVSVFRHPRFGKDYGVTITNGPLEGLLSRAVVILDEKGKVIFTEHVSEITSEPNYNDIVSYV